jgi:hypothetical protein
MACIVAAMGERCGLAQAWVVSTPEQQDCTQCEDAIRVVHWLAVVFGGLTILPEQQVVRQNVQQG